MSEPRNLLSGFDDVDLVQHLVAELHDDLRARVARLHMLADMNRELGVKGAMLTGGTISGRAWIEARASFINGHFVATVLLCQGLMENLLASELQARIDSISLPGKATAKAIRRESLKAGLISAAEERDLELLELLRNPLIHYREANDPEHIDQQASTERTHGETILERNAQFAIVLTMQILAKPSFRL